MWQQLSIAIAVPLATAYVVWTFLSAPRRLWLLDRLSQMLPLAALGRVAQRYRTPTASGCAGCSSHAQQVRR